MATEAVVLPGLARIAAMALVAVVVGVGETAAEALVITVLKVATVVRPREQVVGHLEVGCKLK
jgi:hypothetical protein